MAAKFKSIKNQRTWVHHLRKPCGEQSPYWNYLAEHSRHDDGQLLEPAIANPDVLPENEAEENPMFDYIRLHWKEIGFTKRQIEVLGLVARGLPQEEIAAQIGITQQRISAIIKTVQKKAATWYRNIQNKAS